MKLLKINQLSVKILLIFIGMGYFTFFSGLDITPFLKGYVAIIPVQILAIFYILYLYFKSK